MGATSNEKVVDLTSPIETDWVPMFPFKVIRTGLPFYQDAECTQPVEGAHLCILQILDPDDLIIEQDIVPTRRNYKQGDYVTWELDNKTLWEECWFRDPETGEIQKAWNIHVLFEGQLIKEEALARERDRLAELERRLNERLSAVPRRNGSRN